MRRPPLLHCWSTPLPARLCSGGRRTSSPSDPPAHSTTRYRLISLVRRYRSRISARSMSHTRLPLSPAHACRSLSHACAQGCPSAAASPPCTTCPPLSGASPPPGRCATQTWAQCATAPTPPPSPPPPHPFSSSSPLTLPSPHPSPSSPYHSSSSNFFASQPAVPAATCLDYAVLVNPKTLWWMCLPANHDTSLPPAHPIADTP